MVAGLTVNQLFNDSGVSTTPLGTFLTNFYFMKNFIILILLFSSFNLIAQTKLTIGESYTDSLSVLKSCKWELSKAKYRDLDETQYDVFLDLNEQRGFMIFRKEKKFIKVWF